MSMTEHKSTSHDGKHTACQLCQKSNAKMKSPNQMKMQPQFKEAYAWLVRHNPTIYNMACICLPCIKQIQRNHMKEFTPRWLPKAPVLAQACNLQHCKYKVRAGSRGGGSGGSNPPFSATCLLFLKLMYFYYTTNIHVYTATTSVTLANTGQTTVTH